MQFFDRPGRSKIALGGSSSRPPTSEQLIARAKKAREERRHRRLQHQSATEIQSVWRRRVAVFEKWPERGDGLDRLLYAAGMWRRGGTVSENVHLVRTSVNSRPFLHQFVTTVAGGEDVMVVKGIVIVLEWITQSVLEGVRVDGVMDGVVSLVERLRGESAEEVVTWGLGVFLGAVVEAVGSKTGYDDILDGVRKIVQRLMTFGDDGAWIVFYRQLSFGLLKIEGILERCTWVADRRFVRYVMKAMGCSGWERDGWEYGSLVQGLELDECAVVLGNVLDMGDEFWNGNDNAGLWSYVSVLSGLIEKLPHRLRLEEGEEEMEDEEVELRECMRKLSVALKKVVSEQVVRGWMLAAVKDGPQAVVRVCQLFNFLTRREQALLSSFQTALAFWRGGRKNGKVHILKSLWTLCIQGEGEAGKKLAEDRLPILLVFARSYSYLLYIQDADEMFESQWPFSMDDVREIVLLLKQYLFTALYVKQGTVTKAIQNTNLLKKEPNLVEEISRLLSRLYACDARRQFRTGDDFWIAGRGALSSKSFVDDAREAGPESLQNPNTVPEGGLREGLGNSRQSAIAGAGELLRVAPYLVPFSTRAKVFHGWVATERDRANGGNSFFPSSGRTVAVRRNFIFDDAFQELNGLGQDLKATIRVKFIDEHGLEEAGIDGGGVFKEFMYEVLRQGFSPFSYALFKATPDGRLYPNPDAPLSIESYKTQYAFLGRLLGKAVFDGVLVDIPLARFFLSKILGQFNYPTDLDSLDPLLYKNMKVLKNYPPELVEDLGLNFTVVNNAFGAVQEVELIANGKNIPVTAENRIEYMHRVANYRMNTQIKEQSEAFLKGFSELVAPEYIRLFSHEELQLLISGKGGKIDLDDLRRNTKYSGGYNEDTMVIKWFWEAMHELNAEDQSKMLQFVTSSPRAPLLGFSYLVPSFCIHKAEGDIRLPTASTCMNLLKLPEYKSFDVVREKLQYALKSNAGFDLS